MRHMFVIAALLILGMGGIAMAQNDPGWPRVKTGPNGKLTVYLPQVESWEKYQVLKAKMAVIAEPNDSEPYPGALEIQAETVVDNQARMVGLINFRINKATFPSAPEGFEEQAMKLLNDQLVSSAMSVSLDRLTAMMGKQQFSGRSVPVKNDAPTIIVSKTPAVLVLIDGDPVLSPLAQTGLLYAVNTNWDVIMEPSTRALYLLNDNEWLSTKDLKKGDWQVTTTLPEQFKMIPDDGNWQEVRKQIPPKAAASNTSSKVYVSTSPAELILFEGEPQMTPISGTNLMYMKNTESDLAFCTGDSNYYYLVSGRWFSSKSLDGPWMYATKNLPPDFAKIPEDHPVARMRASVPGTEEADNAMMLAQVPTMAQANRGETTLTVTYNGTPQMASIEGTNVQYATNTAFNVLQVGPKYYCCYEGVWFESTSPDGPWAVTDNVPGDIYTVPPSSPMYPVTYVQVYETSPQTVTYGYTSGYNDSYIYDGSVVYGTGYYYPPYVGNALVYGVGLVANYAMADHVVDHWDDYWDDVDDWYDHDYPAPYYAPYGYSYGVSASYNPASGTWARGAVSYGPYGGIAGRSSYNPYSGRYSRGYAAYGPNRSGWGGETYNPRTGIHAATRQGSNPYASWGTSVAQRGDDWLRTAHVNDTKGFRTSEGGRGMAGDNHGVVTDSDGNRYIKGNDGWSKYEQGEWKRSAEPRNLAQQQPNRDRQNIARAEGRVPEGAKNNMFVGDDGGVYRGSGENWERLSSDGKWQGVQGSDLGQIAAAAGAGALGGAAIGKIGQGKGPAQLPADAGRRPGGPQGNLAAGGQRPAQLPAGGARQPGAPSGNLGAGTGAARQPGIPSGNLGASSAAQQPRVSNDVQQQLNRDAQARAKGNQSTQKYQNYNKSASQPRTSTPQRSTSGSYRPSSSSSRSSSSSSSRSSSSSSRSSSGSRASTSRPSSSSRSSAAPRSAPSRPSGGARPSGGGSRGGGRR